MNPECQLFAIPACQLCELAEYELMPMIDQGLLVEVVDISIDPVLLDRYQGRTPVLRRVDTGEELEWPFEALHVVSFLRAGSGR